MNEKKNTPKFIIMTFQNKSEKEDTKIDQKQSHL